jgi:hypothetical protein
MEMFSDGYVAFSFNNLTNFNISSGDHFSRINDDSIENSFNSLTTLDFARFSDLNCLSSGDILNSFTILRVMNFSNSTINSIICPRLCGIPTATEHRAFNELATMSSFGNVRVMDFTGCIYFAGLNLSYVGPAEVILEAIDLQQCVFIVYFNQGYGGYIGTTKTISKSIEVPVPDPSTMLPTSAPVTGESSSKTDSLSSGAIVGIAIGGAMGLILIVVLMFKFFKIPRIFKLFGLKRSSIRNDEPVFFESPNAPNLNSA